MGREVAGRPYLNGGGEDGECRGAGPGKRGPAGAAVPAQRGQPAHQREPAVSAPGDSGPWQAFVARQPPCSLNRWPNHRSSSMCGQASPFSLRFRPRRSGSGQDACLTHRPLYARFSRCPLLARTADGECRVVGQPPAVSGADGSLGVAVLDTGYGAAGVLMWYQRERSLVPCSLMALIR